MDDSQASEQRWWKIQLWVWLKDIRMNDWLGDGKFETDKKKLAMLFATIGPTMTEMASTYNCIEPDDKSKVKNYFSDNNWWIMEVVTIINHTVIDKSTCNRTCRKKKLLKKWKLTVI